MHPDHPEQCNVDALGTVERFFSEILDVPRPEERLAALLYMRTYGPGVQQVGGRCNPEPCSLRDSLNPLHPLQIHHLVSLPMKLVLALEDHPTTQPP